MALSCAGAWVGARLVGGVGGSWEKAHPGRCDKHPITAMAMMRSLTIRPITSPLTHLSLSLSLSLNAQPNETQRIGSTFTTEKKRNKKESGALRGGSSSTNDG